jgi:hypothetical protein
MCGVVSTMNRPRQRGWSGGGGCLEPLYGGVTEDPDRSLTATLLQELVVDVAFERVQRAIAVDRFDEARVVPYTVAVPVEDDPIPDAWGKVEGSDVSKRLFEEGDIRPSLVGRGFAERDMALAIVEPAVVKAIRNGLGAPRDTVEAVPAADRGVV